MLLLYKKIHKEILRCLYKHKQKEASHWLSVSMTKHRKSLSTDISPSPLSIFILHTMLKTF